MAKPVIAVIGAGLMGSSHARVVTESDDAALGIVIDADRAAAERVAARYWARASDSLEDAMSADAVIVATSTASHVACALPFIAAGIPTFVEKPMAPTLAEADTLLEAAVRHDVPVMCGLVERFNAALRSAGEQITGPPTHMIAVRHSPPAPRIASSVVADMLLHDLDIAVRLFAGEMPELAGSAGHRPAEEGFIEIADCSLWFPSGLATLSSNRMSQRKVRTLAIHSTDQTVEVDLLRQDVTVYRNVSQEMVTTDGLTSYRASTEIDIPFVRHTGEPLSLQFAHFLRLVAGTADHAAEREGIRLPHVLMEEIESAHPPVSSSMAEMQNSVASEP